jgi:hypothetical protein
MRDVRRRRALSAADSPDVGSSAAAASSTSKNLWLNTTFSSGQSCARRVLGRRDLYGPNFSMSNPKVFDFGTDMSVTNMRDVNDAEFLADAFLANHADQLAAMVQRVREYAEQCQSSAKAIKGFQGYEVSDSLSARAGVWSQVARELLAILDSRP